MMPDRPSIPSEIKRSIRQKCNYGCVVCGCPIYQIDHLKKEWHEYHEHDETDMFLLCPTHHTEKTNGLLSTDKILKCFSSINDTTKPHLLNIEKCTLFLGNNKIETFPGVLFNIFVTWHIILEQY